MKIGRIVQSNIIKGVVLKFLQLALEFTCWGARCVVPVIANPVTAALIFVGTVAVGAWERWVLL